MGKGEELSESKKIIFVCKMISADVKANKNKKEIKDLVAVH